MTSYIINRDKLKATGRENRQGRVFFVFAVSTFKYFGIAADWVKEERESGKGEWIATESL